MTRISNNKLNHFLVSAPSGVVLTTAWLESQGISPKLAWWYVHSGLLERVGPKAYKKAGDQVPWQGMVAACQSQLNLPLHVGGKTALQLLGRAHFVPLQGMRQIILFANERLRYPKWLQNADTEHVEFQVYATMLFDDKAGLLGIIDRKVESTMIQLSSPERAIMEMIYLFPKHQSPKELLMIMENLGQLRPAMVQSLLQHCHSIKVKRVFLSLAEKCQHPWFNQLNIKKIDLGSGKRVIGGGGHYDSKYMISLPDMTEE